VEGTTPDPAEPAAEARRLREIRGETRKPAHAQSKRERVAGPSGYAAAGLTDVPPA
jgi:hypothetical protein